MKKRERIAGLAALCIVTGVFAGCGAGKGESMSADGGSAYNGSYVGTVKTDGAPEWQLSGSAKEAPGAEGADGAGYTEGADTAGSAGYTDGADVMVSDAAEAYPEAPGAESVPGEAEAVPGGFFAEPTVMPQAGLLTAGEWRDNENWGFFVNLVQTGRFTFRTFGMAPYERVVVQALSNGEPAGQVKVTLNTVTGSTIAAAVTDHDGIAYLYYNVFGGREEADYVTLTKPDGSQMQVSLKEAVQTNAAQDLGQTQKQEPHGGEDSDGESEEIPANTDVQETNGQGGEQQNGQQQSGWQGGQGDILKSTELTVELGETVPSVRALDLMFVFDTTGSMGDELLYLQKEFEDIAVRVADQSTRFSVNFYRDQGDEYIVRSNPFSDDIKATAALINAEYANGGGDYEEAVDAALLDAVLGHTWREEAVKLMFFILDAPPHDTQETAENLKRAVEEAAAQGIRIIPIASSGVNEKTEGFLRSIAMLTGGTYTFLTDDSGIGGSHLEPTVGAYTVEALNDMIVRLIKEYYGE